MSDKFFERLLIGSFVVLLYALTLVLVLTVIIPAVHLPKSPTAAPVTTNAPVGISATGARLMCMEIDLREAKSRLEADVRRVETDNDWARIQITDMRSELMALSDDVRALKSESERDYSRPGVKGTHDGVWPRLEVNGTNIVYPNTSYRRGYNSEGYNVYYMGDSNGQPILATQQQLMEGAPR